MKKQCIILLLILLLFHLHLSLKAQSFDFDWVRQFGDTGNIVTTMKLATDSLSNVYTLGIFSGTADFDPGPNADTLTAHGESVFFLSKLDSSGGFLWVRQLQRIRDMAVDKYGNVYVLGTCFDSLDADPGPAIHTIYSNSEDGSAYILKLNPAGNFRWVKTFGGSYNCTGSSIMLDAHQNVYTAGTIQGPNTDFDPDTSSYLLSTPYTSLTSTPYYFVNLFVSKLDSGGKFVYAKTLARDSDFVTSKAVLNNQGEVIVCSGQPGGEVYIYKFDANGNTAWTRSLPPNSLYSMATDRANYISLTGYFRGSMDFDPGPGVYTLASPSSTVYSMYVLQLDNSGNFNWVRNVDGWTSGGGFYSPWLPVVTDSDRNIYIAGAFTGTVNFDPGGQTTSSGVQQINGFILRYNYYGGFDWVKQIGQNSNSEINSIALDSYGDIYTGGFFSATADFDPGPAIADFTATGQTDAFVHKLNKTHLPTGIKKVETDNAERIFPNPTTGMIYIQLDKNLERGTCRLTDINGRVVQENKNISGVTFALNISEQTMGIYILEVLDAKMITRVKVVKE